MKAILIDDERLARVELRRLLAAHPEIEIAGEAQNSSEAIGLIAEVSPDLLFLDIEMPGASGFDLLEQLDDVPQVVFTTAFDEYAIKAFEVNALDYLLKPISPARLAAALLRVVPPPAPSRLLPGLPSGWRTGAGSFACRRLFSLNRKATIRAYTFRRSATSRFGARSTHSGRATRPCGLLPREPPSDSEPELD